MAATALRVVRRPKGQPRRALTAASQPVTDVQKTFRATMPGVEKNDWQADAWRFLDLVGELRYYTGWRAASCSRVRLIASEIDEETGLPTGGLSEDNPDAADISWIVSQIAGGALGQAQFVKRCAECLTIPGEVWAAILIRNGTAEWYALSKEEITRRGQNVEIELPTGDKHVFNQAADSMFRIWNSHPRRAKEADSPVRASLDPLREIVRTTKTIANASKSRLIGNGVVFVPQEMSLPANTSPVPTASNPGSDAGSDEPVLPLEGTPAIEQLQQLLWKVAETAYDDEDSMAALIPMFAAVPGELINQVQHLKFENTVTEVAIKTRNDAIARLAMGLDVSPERLLGMGGSSNHWSAWLIEDSDVQLHIAPVMETICQAITDQVLRVVLEREGFDPTRYVLWYDAGRLTADPDKSSDATNAFDRSVINAEALRDYLGLSDTAGYDFDSMEGWTQWATDRIAQDPTWLQTLQPFVPMLDGMDFGVPAPELPPGGEEPPTEVNPQQEPQTEDQQPGTQIVPAARDHSTIQLTIIDMYVSRALELVGKRLRTHADHARLRHVPMHHTHRYMKPVNERDIPKLMAGWDATLEEEVLARVGLDTDAVRAAVRRAVTAQLTTQVVDA